MSKSSLDSDKPIAPTNSADKPSGAVQAETLIAELAAAFLQRGAADRTEGGAEPAPEYLQFQNPEKPMYRALVEQIPAVIFVAYLDRGVSEAYVSPQIEATLGFSQEEWLDDPIRWYQQIHPDDRERWSVEAAEMFAQGKHLKSSYRVLARDGKVVWFRCEVKMMRHDDGRPWFVLGVGFDITELKRTEEALRERTEAFQRLSATLFQLQDQERRRIARELHDGLGQYLVALKLNFDMLGLQMNSQGKIWAESQEILEQCIAETRTISYLLHPPMLDDAGLMLAAKWYVEGFSERSGIKASLDISPDLPRLSKAVELTIFRVLQESLTNVHRHSGSKSVEITMRIQGADVHLEVRDHGTGMKADVLRKFQETGSQVGVGLAGMRQRVNELGGRFEINSDSHGTAIKVVIPRGPEVRMP
jgi:PAS domain S-box-containing protein